MTPGDSEITVERLQEIIELTLELEEEIPEEIGIVVRAGRLKGQQGDDAHSAIQDMHKLNPLPALEIIGLQSSLDQLSISTRASGAEQGTGELLGR